MPTRLAIVYPGDAAARRTATPQNNRFAALFAAFAEAGVQAEPVVYADAWAGEVREQLLAMDGALVWVNPIEAGRSRDVLDATLRAAAGAGVFVSTHPDTILKLGTKDVLVETRHLGWGSDCWHVDSLAQLHADLPARLAAGARVLKQWRGHSGIGVWRFALAGDGRVELRHAQRGSAEELLPLDAAIARMAPYFESSGHMVDQAWQPRLPEGMTRCYLVQDRVVGFGVQALVALHPEAEPGPRLYHPADLADGQGLRRRLEDDWLPALLSHFGLARDALPMLWDCDFLRGAADGDWVLCEINVSSVAPFPDSAIAPLVQAVQARLA
ncbi:Cj0069 family protein [Roseateles sp. P5_E7]